MLKTQDLWSLRLTKGTAESESSIQKAIVAYLRGRGFFAFAIYNGSSPTILKNGDFRFRKLPVDRIRGVPDVLALKRNRAIFFEVKSLKGRLSKEQKEVHARLFKEGFEVYVVRSVQDVCNIVD
jgi:hypothetical protein